MFCFSFGKESGQCVTLWGFGLVCWLSSIALTSDPVRKWPSLFFFCLPPDPRNNLTQGSLECLSMNLSGLTHLRPVCCFVTNWIQLVEELGSLGFVYGKKHQLHCDTLWSCGCMIDNNVTEGKRQRERKMYVNRAAICVYVCHWMVVTVLSMHDNCFSSLPVCLGRNLTTVQPVTHNATWIIVCVCVSCLFSMQRPLWIR